MTKSNKIDYSSKKTLDRTVFFVAHAMRDIPAAEMARKSGLSEQTIRNIRLGPKHGGVRFPRGFTLQMICEALGIPFEQIIAQANGRTIQIQENNTIDPLYKESLKLTYKQKEKKVRPRIALAAKVAPQNSRNTASKIIPFRKLG